MNGTLFPPPLFNNHHVTTINLTQTQIDALTHGYLSCKHLFKNEK